MNEIEDKLPEIVGQDSKKMSFELKTFASLAIPIYFSQLASHATGVIAALMTGSYSTLDQAAVATGNMLFWPVFFWIGWKFVHCDCICSSILWGQKES